jgi:alanine dehydrogenase
MPKNGVLLLSRQEVDNIIDRPGSLAAVVPGLTELMSASVRGGTSRLPRSVYGSSDAALGALLLAGARASGAGASVRAYTAIPGVTAPRPGWAARLLFGEDLTLRAVFPEAMVHELRTGAGVGVVLQTLAPPTPVVAVIGSGRLARSCAIAASEISQPKRIQIFSPTADNSERLATELAERCNLDVTACADIESAVSGADVVITATSASQRILPELSSQQALIIAVGLNELTAEQVLDGTLYVTGLAEVAGNPEPLRGLAAADQLDRALEFCELLGDAPAPRTTAPGPVWVVALGTAVWDLATANWLVDRAIADGVGTWTSALD